MDPKRELTSVDIAALVGELDEYTGALVEKAYLYDDDLIRLRMRHFDHGRVEFLIEVGDWKRAHVAAVENVPDAPDRPPNFARMLRNQIGGAELVEVNQYEFDRILVLTFERGGEQTDLIAELFGDGNFIVCDATGSVVDSLDTVRLHSRTVAPGSPYEFPETHGNPFTISYDEYEAVLRNSSADLVRTLATELNLGGRYAEEFCARAEIEKSIPAADAPEKVLRRIYDELQRFWDTIRQRDFDPVVYYADDSRVDVSPVRLEIHADHSFEDFESFNSAVDDYFTNREDPDEEKSDEPDLDSEIARQERIIEQQESAIDNFDREAAETRGNAELLYENYDLVDSLLSTIRLARDEGRSWDEIESRFSEAAAAGNADAAALVALDSEHARATVEVDETEIELDISVGVEKNADRLYKEAKRIEEKRTGAQEALERSKAELEELLERRAQGQETEPEPDDSKPESAVDWLDRESIPVRQPETWYDRFRWFRSSDGYLVLGGRNADQNEELVEKYLEPNDLFVHAQAHGGPVTIIKATAPSEPSREVTFPEQTRTEAAIFAISYSSVWKAGQYSGDAYIVTPDQVSKEPEPGEYISKGEFVIRGEREYRTDLPVGVSIGITCEPETRVIGGPGTPIKNRAETTVEVEPGNVAQEDVAKRIYRLFRERFRDTTFVRKVASPDRIQEFLPPGRSTILDDSDS